MNRQFLIYTLCIVSVLHNGLLAHQNQQGQHDYKQIECTLIPITRFAQKAHGDTHEVAHASHPHIPALQSADTRAPENSVSSNNWSGYVAEDNFTTPTTDSVTSVSGSWIVPEIVPTCDDNYSAYWVGIDGFTSSTVEQIGTEHDYIGGALQYYAWFEMFPGPSFLISGFPVNPGDLINASVVYAGSNVFTLSITNETQSVSFTVPSSETTMAGTQRNSAEWIVEAPFLSSILPLADFVTASVRNGTATINGITAPINNSNWQNESITMVTTTDVPKATPSAIGLDNESFFVVWEHE